MNALYKKILAEVFNQVLERFAFMFGDSISKKELSEIETAYRDDLVQSEIFFSGELKGKLSIAVPLEMCVETATNTLGMELEQKNQREAACDAIEELLNITCGQLLIAIAGKKPIFDLSIPTIFPIGEAEWNNLLEEADSVAFLVDDYPVLVKLACERATTPIT
ncbi:chemotaxis protein CheX [Candidatus Auribacterota bacterium]